MFTLHNGDCLEYMKSLHPKSVDVSFTSPPYNRKRNDKYKNYTDQVEDYYGWMCDVIDELLRVTKRHVFFNIQANYYNRQDVYKLIGKYSEKIVEIVIWEKDNPMPASGLNITNAVEYFIVLGDEPLRSNRTYTKNTIHSSVNSKMGKIHKAVMNQDIADYFISTFTKEGESVLDCFLGLGTTGIACVKFNRDFYGSEKDVEYFSIAEKRIQEAVLSQGFFTPSNKCVNPTKGILPKSQAVTTPQTLFNLESLS